MQIANELNTNVFTGESVNFLIQYKPRNKTKVDRIIRESKLNLMAF